MNKKKKKNSVRSNDFILRRCIDNARNTKTQNTPCSIQILTRSNRYHGDSTNTRLPALTRRSRRTIYRAELTVIKIMFTLRVRVGTTQYCVSFLGEPSRHYYYY